ncbi:Hypothetical protein I5071_61000 [Sandaracinus amylolyticus]|nr:Hypothetical protein I5071_61000 [Sandaracinus amylolyticus]
MVVRPTEEVCAALWKTKIELSPADGFAVVAIRGGLEAASALAAEVARESRSEVLALFMQTSVDAYSIEEHGPSGPLRRLVYAREGAGWATIEGEARPWEVDLHFHGDREGFLTNLHEHEWSDAEIDAAAAAWDARSVAMLPRLPPLTARAFSSFVARYGKTAAVADRRGFLARLLRFG